MSEELPPTKCPECEEVMILHPDGLRCPGCGCYLKLSKTEAKTVATFAAGRQASAAYAEKLQDDVTRIKRKNKPCP